MPDSAERKQPSEKGVFMEERILTIGENIPLTDSVYRMTLRGDELPEQRPGIFQKV